MRSKTKTREPKTYEFTEAIATESLRPFVGAPIDKGLVLPVTHELVRRFPRSFRYLGPHPDPEEV
jgi:hypothetical protein